MGRGSTAERDVLVPGDASGPAFVRLAAWLRSNQSGASDPMIAVLRTMDEAWLLDTGSGRRLPLPESVRANPIWEDIDATVFDSLEVFHILIAGERGSFGALAGLGSAEYDLADGGLAPLVYVVDKAQGHGLGSVLLAAITEEARSLGASCLTHIMPSDPPTEAWLARHGHRSSGRRLEMHLDLGHFGGSRPLPAGLRVVDAGSPLVAPGALADFVRRAWTGLEATHPRRDPSATLGEQVLGDARARLSSLVALRDTRIVGCALSRTYADDADTLDSFLTAVAPDERGRGLATALKSTALEQARRAGYRAAVTGVTADGRMRRVNEVLGFTVSVELTEMTLTLGDGCALRVPARAD